MSLQDLFDLSGRVAIITGGAGLLGAKHVEAIAEAGGVPVVLDLPSADPASHAVAVSRRFGARAISFAADVTDEAQLEKVRREVLAEFGRIDILINNAANNPKMEAVEGKKFIAPRKLSGRNLGSRPARGSHGRVLVQPRIWSPNGCRRPRRNPECGVRLGSNRTRSTPLPRASCSRGGTTREACHL